MFFILSKILSFVINPLFWLVLFLILAIKTKKAQRRKKLIICSLIIGLFFSNTFIYNEFALAWEHQISNQTSDNKSYEVAIVMGGVIDWDNDNNQLTFSRNAERITSLLPLYFEGRIKKILIAGGTSDLKAGDKEAILAKEYLIRLKVKEEDILTDEDSRNTYENAFYAKKVLGENNITGSLLLSTSAIHMPRSLACFQKLGLNPTPYPVDYTSREKKRYSLGSFIVPRASVINNWYWLIHEWMGMLIYKVMGYC